MSVVIKRSEIPVAYECGYGCCTDVYGKHVRKIRRALKRRQEQTWRRDLRREQE